MIVCIYAHVEMNIITLMSTPRLAAVAVGLLQCDAADLRLVHGGLARTVALCCRSSTSYQGHSHTR
jgi:hypothetical protein